MSGCYLDASAVVKLATREPETSALRRHLDGYSHRVTSRLTWIEVPRALARKGPKSLAVGLKAVTAALESLVVIELDESVAATAASLGPPTLRFLDAIHLASALSVGDELAAFITYDSRLAKAARAAGLEVVSPA